MAETTRRNAVRRFLAASLGSLIAAAAGVVVVANPAAAAVPTAVDDAYMSSGAGTTFTVAAPGVLGNDQNLVGGESVILQEPTITGGSIGITDNGSFTYEPSANFSGTDRFGYCLGAPGSSECASNRATVTLTVPPVAGDPPGAPTEVLAIAGVGSASISFTPPPNEGSTFVHHYEATCDTSGSGARSANAQASPVVVTGLTNGVTYACRLLAVNASGPGPFSSPDVSVTPTATADENDPPVLTVPSSITTQAGSTHFFSGLSLTDPDAEADDDLQLDVTATGGTVNITTLTANVSSLNSSLNAMTYQGSAPGSGSITITANDLGHNGTGGPKTDTKTIQVLIDPAGGPQPPGEPTDVSAEPGEASASVSFTAPTNDGGRPILDYTATCGSQSATGTASPITVSGLVNGVTVQCFVQARNVIGTGNPSTSVSVTPGFLPGAPTNVVATPGPGSITISFSPPASAGSAPITDYTATCTNSEETRTKTGAGSPLMLTELSLSTYSCTVHATSSLGDGPESSPPVTAEVQAATVPGAPIGVSAFAGDSVVAVQFSPPTSDGGRSITGYTATCTQDQGGDAAPVPTSAPGEESPISIFGLVNGVVASCTVHATNSLGDGPESSPPATTTPLESSLPSPPRNVQAAAAGAQAILTFDPPTDDGGAPVFRYAADCSISIPGDSMGIGRVWGSGPPIVVDVPFDEPRFPPDDGITVICRLVAFNANGGSPFSESSPPVTVFPSNFPGAPTGVSAVAGNGQATVSFSPPTSDGGSPITSYRATCGDPDDGGGANTGTASPIVVTGLTNGLSMFCVVRATNDAGTGPQSFPPVAVTPTAPPTGTVPGAPRGVTAAPGNGQATVTFFKPLSNGGSGILDYTATCGAQSATGSSSPLLVTGLTNGVLVNCTVTARNAIGTGPASSPPASVRPATTPGAPLNVAATPGNAQATVTFAKPASNGGSGILDYTATCGAQSATGTGSPLVVTGLTNGTTVQCSVRARNAIGSGPASATVSVRPATVPGAPRGVAASPGNGRATVTFFKPLSNGGNGITGYTATCGTRSSAATGSPIIVTGLVNGVTVQCTVRASNAVGNGPASSPPVSVTPRP